MFLYEKLKTLNIIHEQLGISQSKLFDTPQKYLTYPPPIIHPLLNYYAPPL